MPTAKHRVSINLTEQEYTQLSDLAQQSRLSMAWLAREALIEYLRERAGGRPSRRVVPALQEAGR
jgi:predicted transcriptional regulator